MKKYILSIAFMLATVATFAQADTAAITGVYNIAGIEVPQWLYVAFLITGATLAATQTILARFPTDRSIKIRGVIGFILDIIAFFPPDNRKGGGTFRN